MAENNEIQRLAELIRQQNVISAQIARLIGRPAQIGHVGEFIASRVFDIELEKSATAKAIDGRFRQGVLAGRSVNVKWYAKREGLLDITPMCLPDFYLVLTGPSAAAVSSRGSSRLWFIESAYLFDAKLLVEKLTATLGIATSVKRQFWDAAEIHPRPQCPLLQLTNEQHELLSLLSERAVIEQVAS